MKALVTLILLILEYQCFAQQASTSQFEPSMKFGKPSEKELEMKIYTLDTTATAVVLYSRNIAHYEIISNKFRIVYEYQVRIKVLKKEGTSYANINIPFYSNERNGTVKETITQIDATSYNIEKGEVVRTKMKHDLIFEERLNSTYKQVKFSIPAVREGTVFEYTYLLNSDLYTFIKPWEAQLEIPVMYAKYNITIPEYFKFSLDIRGSYNLNPKDETDNLVFTTQNGNGQLGQMGCNGRYLEFSVKDLPALHHDDYIWCSDDYRSGVNFEMNGYCFPLEPYISLTQTWEEIDKILLEDNEFGRLLKMRNPYQEEMSTLRIDTIPNRKKKIAAIYTFLKKKISWNNSYQLYSYEIKKVIQNGTGSNADINFVLMSMLRDAKITCHPVVMSCKNRGIIPITHPSIRKLNTFVVCITDTDSTFVFLDGSVTNGYINTLPPVLTVNRAHLITGDGGNYWVDLSKLSHNRINSQTVAQLQPDGKIIGNRHSEYIGQHAAAYRNRYQSAKDSADFINQQEGSEKIKIKKFRALGVQRFSPKLLEDIMFEKQVTINNNLIYLNPLIFLHVSKCPFTQTERQLPLEMPFPEKIDLAVTLTIPVGYTVEEIPRAMELKTKDGLDYCSYNISQEENSIHITYTFFSNKLLYLADEYKNLKSFWEAITNKNNEMIVLKKL